jgi:hypothetical protein
VTVATFRSSSSASLVSLSTVLLPTSVALGRRTLNAGIMARSFHSTWQLIGFERRFGVTLQRSADGCPFIRLAGRMPSDYNWNTVAVSCRGRLERTRILCNRKHLIEDSAYALFAEMIRSACIDHACIVDQCHEQDTHLLHLPKHLAAKHPLRVSVAHKHHGPLILPGRASSSTSIGSTYK